MKSSGDRVIARLGKQAPAGVPVPHEFGHFLFNLLHRWVAKDDRAKLLRARRWFLSVFHLVITTLREIFDENAYERFLSRTHASRCVESYRAFLQESEAAVARKPRCC